MLINQHKKTKTEEINRVKATLKPHINEYIIVKEGRNKPLQNQDKWLKEYQITSPKNLIYNMLVVDNNHDVTAISD